MLAFMMMFIVTLNSLMMIGLWKTIKQFQLGQLLLFSQSSIGFLLVLYPYRYVLLL